MKGGQAQATGTSSATERARPIGAAGSAAKPLQSLTPCYDADQHETYLRRLEEAIREPRNLNIALTGRYGAGKSSVLDQFQADHRKTTQRLAIATLAPGEEGETTTNRIQKEIVKQLVYGASEKVGKNSRFSKIAVLSKPRAVWESVVVVGCFGTLLYLLGWLPDIKWTGAGESTPVRVTAWVGAAALATAALAILRVLTFGRLLSDVSAAGAGLTLADKPDTFFDKYLDEIVHYFSREARDIVIFEDLDRFEDPHIFEALRELNILLNETPERRAKRRGNRPGRLLRHVLGSLPGDIPSVLTAKLPYRWANRALGLGTPLRFIYAVKDSVFEKLDFSTAMASWSVPVGAADNTVKTVPDDPTAVVDSREGAARGTERPFDAAAAETLRANRTKFFDIVIPLVPFISHRTARDLLLDLLAQRGITGIERRLVNTVAQHSTDMRLLRNMCNEYLVFAERLLESGRPAPGMDESRLFALIAYKNFHLEDFENITRRDSDLDCLYDLHVRLQRSAIAAAEARKRALLAGRVLLHTRADTAERLGRRLRQYAAAELRNNQYGFRYSRFVVGTTTYSGDEVTEYSFWAAVARAQSLKILGASGASGGQTMEFANFDRAGLEMFVPEGLDADQWSEYDEKATQAELAELEGNMERLRRADFKDLAAMPEFKLQDATSAEPSTDEGPLTFEELLTATMKSELARDLVRRGYIDRNFSLYAAQFYGDFTGVDVANFMVQHVQTNTMAVDYDLSRDGAVANLLTEAEDAGEELLHSHAAYNIDIVNHLLATDDPGVGDVIDHLIAAGPDDDARTFLAAYFTAETARRAELAARLTVHRWSEVFTYLVEDDGVPADVRPALVSAALCSFVSGAGYRLDDYVREFITSHYRDMAACTGPYPPTAGDPPAEAKDVAQRVAGAIDKAGIVIPQLAALDEQLRRRIVEIDRYELTADNLRSALGISDDVSLDNVQQDQTVYDRCLSDLPAYLAAVRDDSETDFAVRTVATLQTVLEDLSPVEDETEQAEVDGDDLAGLLALASPQAQMRRLRDAPTSTWPALAEAGLFRSSLANIEDYRTAVGSIDAALAALLARSGTVHVDEPGDVTAADGSECDRDAAAIAILNTTLLPTATRVALAASAEPKLPLPVDDITAEASDLFALLLGRDLVADDDTSFEHFHAGGWPAIGPAISTSTKIGDFISPPLVQGMISDLLADPACPEKVAREVVTNIEDFEPNDDWAALKAAAHYADSHQIALSPDTVLRIARVADESSDRQTPLVLRLLAAARPTATADQVIDAFGLLGDPYVRITETGAKFDVDQDTAHEQLLAILAADGRISRRSKRGRNYAVTVQ